MTAQEFFKNDRFATNAGVEPVSYTHLVGSEMCIRDRCRTDRNKGRIQQGTPGYHGRASQCRRPYARRGHLHPCRPGTGSSSQLPRNIGLLSFVQYHLPAQQRTGRCTVCRSTRTLHRPHHRILPDRRHQPGGKTDCHFRIQCI